MPGSPELTSRGTLVGLLKRRSLKIGEFTLASGLTSHYYVDARLTTMSAEGLQTIGPLGVAMIADAGWRAAAVGGLTLGADPVAYAIAMASRDNPPVMDAFTVRKQPKDHGTGRRIEGCFGSASEVIVVEDVITTGNSALKAAQAVEDEGGRVVGVLGVVDRMEGGRDTIEAAGYPVLTMVTVRDLGVESRPDSGS
jgi:orotate phosphoribosyltransferase